jgi:hypothetical protein
MPGADAAEPGPRTPLRNTPIAGGVNSRGSGAIAVTDSTLFGSIYAEAGAVIERNHIRGARTDNTSRGDPSGCLGVRCG